MFFKNKPKTFESILKKEKDENRERLIVLYDYVEGRIEGSVILGFLRNDEQFIDFCVKLAIKGRRKIVKDRLEWVKNSSDFSLEVEANLFHELSLIFTLNNIQGNYVNSAYLEMQLISESSTGPFQLPPTFLIGLSKKEMLPNLSQDERRNWYTQKTLELCKYDEYPPFNCDFLWPFYEGRPMIFSHQKTHGNKIIFYFYDEQTGKKKTITDYV